jgi:cellulose synthase/poly-beta-1,6-N-acetylglucosamine synthase-like glycosyltransferase
MGLDLLALEAWQVFLVSYFVLVNSTYLAYYVIAAAVLWRHRRRWTPRRLDGVLSSPATPGISLVAPAFNEAATIRDSVRSLLLLHYPQFEVIVVNDGSTDATLDTLVTAFGLACAPGRYLPHLQTEPVTALYRSATNADLVVVDKRNGGKADAVNAGINAARYPLVCVTDADSLLEDDALARAVLPFIERPDTDAVGGMIRLANGCVIEGGRVTRVRRPRSRLACFQVVEYLRGFLIGRVAPSSLGALILISGAFGVFRRDSLIEAGGYSRDTVGEDMEITVRLHQRLRDAGRRARIVFQPDAVCWTQAPESAANLRSQRRRWHRATIQVMSRYRSMMFRRRYGMVGMFALPFCLLSEVIGPLITAAGLVTIAAGVTLGVVDRRFVELVLVAGLLYGTALFAATVILEDVVYRRHERVRDVLWLAACGALMYVWYRPLTIWWQLEGTADFVRRRQGWGVMHKKGFATT